MLWEWQCALGSLANLLCQVTATLLTPALTQFILLLLLSSLSPSLLLSRCAQMDKLTGHFGLVVVTRAGSNPEKFIHESDALYKNRVSGLQCWKA